MKPEGDPLRNPKRPDMPDFCRRAAPWTIGPWLCVILGLLLAPIAVSATEVILKDGRVLRGNEATLPSLTNVLKVPPPGGAPQTIIVLDDNLRRTFFPKVQVREVRQDPGGAEEKFKVWQKVQRGGATVKSVGPVLDIKPFDDFGRRTFTFNTTKGPVTVVQGITEITPNWTKVEGANFMWDMRMDTNAIPQDTLHKILLKQIDEKKLDHHKKIIQFYIQSKRYEKAGEHLDVILKQFGQQPGMQADWAPIVQSVRQFSAQRLLSELKMRRDAGQHLMVQEKLKAFPRENVAGAVLQEVSELLEEYKTLDARRADALKQLDALVAKIGETAVRNELEPICKEIATELDFNTFGRLAAFRQNLDDQNMTPGEKVALAVSGWLLGADNASVNLPVAISLYKVRGQICKYLGASSTVDREQVLKYLLKEEGAAPPLVAGLLANMKPPIDPPPPDDPVQKPGSFKLDVLAAANEAPIRCLVQLPPEYNPYRRYPAVVTLRGAGTTAEQQIDWWAGGVTAGGWRAGQGSRNGYIVIAPDWAKPHQQDYNYSTREHAAVLNSLRAACQRFAIDTDRVFLSGHSMGGDAAWDIALGHPDLWAGVIPIVAQADRYVAFYKNNARYVPFYLVGGELDGNKLTKNATDLDRYFKAGYNVTVVDYLGRGHEHFYEEILRLFDWMGRFRRDFFPREFACVTMRQTDNFFWWLECGDFPSKGIVDPTNWPPPKGTLAVNVGGKMSDKNTITVLSNTGRVTVWLAPKLVDFKKPITVTAKNRRLHSGFLDPSVATILEDVRTRGDRQNPFWAKVESK
jgi:pimeloyl-ACP methyl ester carboxylesterase